MYNCLPDHIKKSDNLLKTEAIFKLSLEMEPYTIDVYYRYFTAY